MNRVQAIVLPLLYLLACTFAGLAWGQGAQTKGDYLEVAGTKIYYEECGAGPNVVLLHDGLLHSNTWDGAWDALCKKYHVVRYDRRGYGRSEPAKAQYSPTEDLYALLTHLKMRRAIVTGNSSGGALAIDFALAHPEMTEGLVLLGPVVQGMDTTAHFDERAQKNMAPLAKGDLKGTAELWSKDRYIVAADHDAARKKIYDTLAQSSQDLTHSSGFEIPNKTPSLYRLSEIEAPTLILVGEFDIPDVHAHSGAIEAGIPGAQREIINNAGHLIQVELPEIFTQKLGHFVELQERPGIKVPVDVLRTYAGKYDAAPTFPIVVAIEMKDGQLSLEIPGVRGLPLFAESESKFFMKAYELKIEFVKDAGGKVVEAVIYVDGAAVKARRL
jgi:pimeloyl-ACP methyl ester carboxylesterase